MPIKNKNDHYRSNIIYMRRCRLCLKRNEKNKTNKTIFKKINKTKKKFNFYHKKLRYISVYISFYLYRLYKYS